MDQQAKVMWDPYTPGYFENPYEHLKDCRNTAPIQKAFNNSWFFFRYKNLDEILSSPHFLVSNLSQYFQEKESIIFKSSNQCPYLARGTKLWPMYLDGKIHLQVRAAIGKSLRWKGFEQTLIEAVEIVNKEYGGNKRFNLVTYCESFLHLVIKEIIGIKDNELLEKITIYSNMLAKSQDLYIPKMVYQDINSWFLWGKGLFTDSDYFKNLRIYSDENGLDYSEEDIYSITSISIMAAFETSKDNLSVALYEILKTPELIDYVIGCNKHELNLLIEELLRFNSPLQYTVRVNKQPLEYDNKYIPANSKLYLSLASANRDDEVFMNPNTLIPNRTPNEHLAFGKGAHFCLGAAIARQELRYCLKPMMQFLKNYSVANDKPVTWSKQIFMRNIESIEIECNGQWQT